MKHPRFKTLFRDAGLCLALAYVALLPQFYLVYDKGNRFSLDWSPTVRASILLAIGLLAVAYGILYAVARLAGNAVDRRLRRPASREAIRFLTIWIMTAVAIRSAMAIIYATRPATDVLARMVDADWVKMLGYVALPVGLLIGCRERYARTVLGGYRILGAMFVLFVAQSFAWKHDVAAGHSVGRQIEEGATDGSGGLYVLMFDGWGYDPTFGNSEFSLAAMPHLSALLEQATLFHEAYSPGIETWVSMPRFLFQTDERADDYSYAEMRDMLFNRSDFSHFSSIFDLSDRPYKFVGQSAINYWNLLGKRVDYVQPFYEKNEGYFLKERVAGLLGSQLAFFQKIGWTLETRSLNDDSMNESWYQQQRRIRPVLNDVLPRLPAGTFAFIHMLIPHRPYGFLRDGSPRIPPRMDDPDGSFYLDNVYAADAVIGDFVKILKEKGVYDSALIVLTADHGLRPEDAALWERLDVEPFIPEKHVPLVIKYPGQRRRADVRALLTTAQLHPLFSDFLNEPERVFQWRSRQDAGNGEAVPYGRE